MTVLQEILGWSQRLPDWQSDAISRLITSGTLSEGDLADLFALLKAEHGMLDPKGRTANRAGPEQIPVPTQPGVQVKLLALGGLRYVNRIAENQRLTFGAGGLTIIYGDNGSGKSGYSRVLKRACRARDQSEPIHPNAFDPPDPLATAEAVFEVGVNGDAQQIHWIENGPAPPVLSSLAVFDSRCARSYLDEEGGYAYVPYGLDILEELAGACRKLKGMVESEMEATRPDLTPFAMLHGNTAVGQLISGLSAATKTEQVEALAKVSPQDLSRRDTLRKSLRETDPKEKAVQLRRCVSRITRAAERCDAKLALVDDAAVARLRRLADDHQAAQDAAAVATRALREDDSLLTGTGGDAWKRLFEAARRFACEAYPGRAFPELGPDARCLLCQQPLNGGAERLRRFNAFVQQDAERTARSRAEELAVARKACADQGVSLGIDDDLSSELADLDESLPADIREFGAALVSRHAAMNSLQWDRLTAVPACPAARLQSLAVKLGTEAKALEEASDEKARAQLQAELDELEARVQLSAVRAAVLRVVELLVHQERLSRCLDAVKTNPISLKAAELTEQVVSRELGEALNEEFGALGVADLRVSLRSRTQRGKTYHKLRLDLPHAETPGAILSEGEQRAVAIASFLAEVRVGARPGGIVFDDPVSSLDHGRRERVARRLAQEAGHRQVIVFTHDIYFVCLLLEEAQKAKVPVTKQSVARGAQGFGIAERDLPFEGMNTKERVGYLRSQQQRLAKVHRSGEEREYRRLVVEAYQHLRAAWERAVEEVLFGSVVLRFRKGVETQRLAAVLVEDSDCATIEAEMSKCSSYCHDQSPLGGLELPDPDGLLSDIDALDEWRARTERRSQGVRKRRRSKA